MINPLLGAALRLRRSPFLPPWRSLFFLALGAVLFASGSAARAASWVPRGFVLSTVGSGWNRPVGVVFDPSPAGRGRVYVWERCGKVWLVENGVKAAQPMLDLSDEVGWWGDHGLMGFALDPNFQQTGHVYLLYIVDRHHLRFAGTPGYDRAQNEYFAPTIGRITRFTARSADGLRTIDPATRRVLVGESATTGFPIVHLSHGACALAFGTDGTLFASFGSAASFRAIDDGGSDGGAYAPQALLDGILRPKEDVGSFRSQLIDCLNGKVIRIDPATGDGLPTNPFFDPAAPRSAKSRVWALGFRNPFRMSVRPGSGSTNPADGRPGVLVVGDVGETQFEELSVVDGPGLNFGWPLYEGLMYQWSYTTQTEVLNLDAPNPLGGYFKFRHLIVQESLAPPSWPNPLDRTRQIPDSIPRFVHRRPAIDWTLLAEGRSRTGGFDGTTATEIKIGDPGSPVTGPQFSGNCVTAGCFYTGTTFPEEFRGKYFFGDFGKSWVKTLALDANHKPTAVADFSAIGNPTCMEVEPETGALYLVDVIGNLVRKVIYAPGANLDPVVAASASVIAGASPLRVTFSSAGSSDPEGGALAYDWDFGDGTKSKEPNPTHTYTVAGTRRFDARLRVTDGGGAAVSTTVSIFANHALPSVRVLSPINGTKYPIDRDSVYTFTREVLEVAGHPTTSKWELFLAHDDHEHPEPPIFADAATVTLAPAYDPAETYAYRLLLTVTDDLGAAVQREVWLRPNASNVAPVVAWSAASRTVPAGTAPVILDPLATVRDADSPGLEGGELRVTITNPVAGDRMVLSAQPPGPAAVTLDGSRVRHGGTIIGSWVLQNGGLTLSVSLNEAATPAMAEAILRRAAAVLAGGGTRTIFTSLRDGDGGVSAARALLFTASGAPSIGLASGNTTVAESAGHVRFTLVRQGDATTPVSANVATWGGNATPGVDYTRISQVVSFAAGQTTAVVAIPILPDSLNETDETFTFGLTSVSSGASMRAPSFGVVTVRNVNTPALQFAAAAFTVAENAGTGTVTVWRTGDTAATASVSYATTTGGTAVAGTDFTATSGVLTFAAGETLKSFTVPIRNNTVAGGNRTIALQLTAPGAGAILGARSTASLNIIDDD